MSGIVIDLRTRAAVQPHTETVTEWWDHPAWCLGDCCGGETVHFANGFTSTTGRLHRRALYATAALHDGIERPVAVEVIVERADYIGEVGPTDVILCVEDGGARLNRDQRVALARALIAANDLATDEPPAVAVPPFGGGRASNGQVA